MPLLYVHVASSLKSGKNELINDYQYQTKIKMNIILSHKYSELDRCEQFGLVFQDPEQHETYIRWVWFHLGAQLKDVPSEQFRLYPFDLGKIWKASHKTYKYCNDGTRQAKFIANRIIKILNK